MKLIITIEEEWPDMRNEEKPYALFHTHMDSSFINGQHGEIANPERMHKIVEASARFAMLAPRIIKMAKDFYSSEEARLNFSKLSANSWKETSQ